MANQFSSNLKSLTTRAITAGMKTLLHLFVIAVALFLVVGTAHAQGPCIGNNSPCILVSNGGQIHEFTDNGSTELSSALLSTSGGGGGASEGVACLSGGANVLYVSNGSSYISAYSMNLNSNNQLPFQPPAYATPGGTTGLATNTMILYAAENGYIGSATPLPNSPWLMMYNANTPDSYSHDVGLGVCAPGVSCGYAGNIFTTLFANNEGGTNTGVLEYTPAAAGLMLGGPVQFLPGPLDSIHNCANFGGSVGTRCWTNLSGIAFDNNGNLWANSTAASQNGTFEFAQAALAASRSVL